MLKTLNICPVLKDKKLHIGKHEFANPPSLQEKGALIISRNQIIKSVLPRGPTLAKVLILISPPCLSTVQNNLHNVLLSKYLQNGF